LSFHYFANRQLGGHASNPKAGNAFIYYQKKMETAIHVEALLGDFLDLAVDKTPDESLRRLLSERAKLIKKAIETRRDVSPLTPIFVPTLNDDLPMPTPGYRYAKCPRENDANDVCLCLSKKHFK